MNLAKWIGSLIVLGTVAFGAEISPAMAPILTYLLDGNCKKIFVIGDETVRYDFDGNRDPSGALHRTGWATMLPKFMRCPHTLVNRARRDALAGGIEDNPDSYRRNAPVDPWVAVNRGPYDYNGTRTLMQTEAQRGTNAFLLIQFGTNDKNEGIPEADFKAHLHYYIDDARSLGITPILITPPNRKDTLADTLAPYDDYIRDVAVETNTAVLDLHARSLEVYSRYTRPMRMNLFGATNLDGSDDGLDFNAQGAAIAASWVRDLACASPETADLCKILLKKPALLIASAGKDRNITTQDILDLNGSGIDTDGNITAWQWSENGVTLSQSRLLDFSASTAGTHHLKLTVTGSDGMQAEDTADITVLPAAKNILEDAEDGDIVGWTLYGTTENSAVDNLFDADKGSQVIDMHGNDGLDNGFAFSDVNITDNTFAAWDMRYTTDFQIIIKVKTDRHDPLYLYYTPTDTSRGIETRNGRTYLHFGLGSYADDGRWMHIVRNLQADVNEAYANDSLQMIYGFSFRGSGRIDNLATAAQDRSTPLIHHEEENLTSAAGALMRVSIYYAHEQQRLPTIYFTAGGDLNHHQYDHLLYHLAEEGYTVVAASYRDGFNDTHLTDNFFDAFVKGWQMCEDLQINDDTRVGLVGHSSGAGTLPSLAYRFFVEQQMGQNGRFVFGATPWVDFQHKQSHVLPYDTRFVTQWYENDHGTDPRIFLDMFRHQVLEHKSFLILKQQSDHNTFRTGTPYDLVKEGIYAPLDNLARYTFTGMDRSLIFTPTDRENDVLHILADRSLPDSPTFSSMYDAFAAAGSAYPCDSAAGGVYAPNPRKQACEAYATGYGYAVRSSFEEIPTADVAKPDYLTSYQDPVFDTEITAITDRSSQTGNAHPYPKQGSAFNSDASILRMGYRLYDTQTFGELPLTAEKSDAQAYALLGSPAHGSADIRWSKSDPHTMYVLDSGQKFKTVTLNPELNQTSETHLIDLSALGFSDITTGNNEGNLDFSDRTIVFAAKKDANDTVFALLYTIGNSDLNWTKALPRGLWNRGFGDPDYFDWITVSPDADRLIVSAENKIYSYDMNLSHEIMLAPEAAHGDLGRDIDGNPVYVQFRFDNGARGIWMYDLNGASAIRLLPDKYNGGHISCRNYLRPGWCYVNTSQESHKEVFALRLDPAAPGTVERYAQTHTGIQNRGCVQVNVSPDGTQVLFASDWDSGSADDYQYDADHGYGCSDTRRRVKIDTYRAHISW